MHTTVLVCVPIVVSCVMGAAPLIGVRADADIVDGTAQVESNTNTQSRQNYPQYANNFLHYRPANQRYTYPPKPGYHPNYNYGFEQQQGLMDVLETLVSQDELDCVPKILCDMASNRMRNANGHNNPSNFNNLDSLATLLSGIDDRLASPVVKFGKAFILGYTAKHNSQCQYAYPQCPSDPERLVHYLNSQNGGLLRLFNNLSPPPNLYNQPGGVRNQVEATNSFHIYDYNTRGDKRQYTWQFPSYDDSQIHNYGNDGRVVHYEKGKSLKFSNEDNYQNDFVQSTAFYFPDNHLKTNEQISASQKNTDVVFRD